MARPRPVAEKTCEMICYLWFAAAEHPYPTPTSSPLGKRNPATTTLQLLATPTFVQFMHKLLETTQVSQSVIVLALHYIYRLKDRNRFTPAQPGSEFRIAVAALMMANKFLDDNTYTNKTWSDVSGIELAEINRMEKEFLAGVDFNLYVDQPTYESWLNLLKGLVLAKERDSRHLRRKPRPPVRPHPAPRHSRARSTSPPATGSKRSADAAFSPAHPSSCKRQLTLHIPAAHSPPQALHSFATMSLASPRWTQTLVTPYSTTHDRTSSVPQNLYFYTLACSPMDTDQDTHTRKARLRYHQPRPHPYPSYAYYHPVVQSASTSPHHSGPPAPTTLPHFHDTQWSRPFRAQQHTPNPTPTLTKVHTPSVPSAPFANAGPPGVRGDHFCACGC
ncbi:hypothetical protein H2248_000174 [Termitomyces sp. 'cryptogamus']|nr:hypothetical protein H2248_000174 [Termitomyces sp. 'cryptogamus']